MFAIVTIFVLVAVLADTIFPNSQFALIIDNTIGKFFNISSFFSTYYVAMLESLTIIFFMWLISKLLTLLISALMKKTKRAEAVGELLKSIVKYLSVLIAFFLILSAWGFQTSTLLS